MKLLFIVSILGSLSILAYGLLHSKKFGILFGDVVTHSHRLCKATTNVSQQLIDGVKIGQLPDNEPSIQYYTLCLWLAAKELDDDHKLIKPKLVEYLAAMNLSQDTDTYIKCNDDAIKSDLEHPHEKIWEMQKCIYKNIPTERFIFY